MARKFNRRDFIAVTGATGIAGIAGCIGEDAEDPGNGNGNGNGDDNETGNGNGDDNETEDGNGNGNGNGNGEDEEEIGEAEPDEGGEVLSWHAGGTGGTYYPLSGEVKSIVEENTPHGLQVQSTGASVENVGSLAREEAEFALIQNDVAYFAFNGTGIEEFEGEPVESIRGVATLYPETIHILTQADSGIESVEDLEGATINTGDAGSGTQVNANQILESAGISDFSEQNTDFATATDQIRDGDVDAAVIVGGWPVGSVEELASSSDISLVSVDGDVREQVKEDAEWMADDTIPGGTYDGVDEDTETVSVQAMIATHEGVDEGIVEEVTTAIFDNTDSFTIKADFISADTAQDGMPIDLHPGASAYFGE
ncbi:TAXI family TRAP transporter solute-binding subunit [Natronosalvus halobius]|uniref:TAXI family TRAP transporter solute-binding subunit n=1 Tax=Natronosalvus halobius TaxID=2953746 RepID=UPI00209E695B|nr:TAXI family TRAP transporter solute-binding subunit [Natronosalvus halobius]USZ71079.1 TAXI family TRAP transporter solute-binding subunit [Natronosalvus halobius]